MIPFHDRFEWQEAYGRYILNIRTGGYCAFDKSPTNGTHAHDFFEVCLITAGSGQYRHGNATFSLEPGDVILAQPGESHEISSLITRDLQLVFFAFELYGAPNSSASTGPEEIIRRLIETRQVHARHHRRLLGYLQVFAREAFSDWILKRSMGAFFTELISVFSTRRSQTRTDVEKSWVSQAIDYIDYHIREPITVSELSLAIGLSERSLRRYFADVLQKTVVAVIRERKLEHASTLLLMNFDVCVTARLMALEPSHFSRAFKQHFGVNPSEFQTTYRSHIKSLKTTHHHIPKV